MERLTDARYPRITKAHLEPMAQVSLSHAHLGLKLELSERNLPKF